LLEDDEEKEEGAGAWNPPFGSPRTRSCLVVPTYPLEHASMLRGVITRQSSTVGAAEAAVAVSAVVVTKKSASAVVAFMTCFLDRQDVGLARCSPLGTDERLFSAPPAEQLGVCVQRLCN
jgi:hypothetical protein